MTDSGYREKAKARFDGECFRCGQDASWSDIEVHHVDRDHGNESLDNLEPICRDCHIEEHNGPDPLWRLTVSMPRPVLEAVDRAVEERGLDSRSEAINRAVSEAYGAGEQWFGGPEESVEAWFNDDAHTGWVSDAAHPPQRD